MLSAHQLAARAYLVGFLDHMRASDALCPELALTTDRLADRSGVDLLAAYAVIHVAAQRGELPGEG